MLRYLSIVLVLTNWIDGSNILVIHPMYAASHVLTIRTLSKNLVSQGHKVIAKFVFFYKSSRNGKRKVEHDNSNLYYSFSFKYNGVTNLVSNLGYFINLMSCLVVLIKRNLFRCIILLYL